MLYWECRQQRRNTIGCGYAQPASEDCCSIPPERTAAAASGDLAASEMTKDSVRKLTIGSDDLARSWIACPCPSAPNTKVSPSMHGISNVKL